MYATYFLCAIFIVIIFSVDENKTCYVQFPISTGHLTHNLFKTHHIYYNTSGTITFDKLIVEPIGKADAIYYNILSHLDKCKKHHKTTKYIEYISDD